MLKLLAPIALCVALPCSAQTDASPAGAPVQSSAVADVRSLWQMSSDNVLAAAQQMPESSFTFRPTPDVRSFGEIVAHVANAQQLICAMALDLVPVESHGTTKTAIVGDLTASNALCARAYAMSDADSFRPLGAEGRKAWNAAGFGTPRSRLHAVTLNAWHDSEHYGNLVTYMRLRGMVPPSSQPRK